MATIFKRAPVSGTVVIAAPDSSTSEITRVGGLVALVPPEPELPPPLKTLEPESPDPPPPPPHAVSAAAIDNLGALLNFMFTLVPNGSAMHPPDASPTII